MRAPRSGKRRRTAERMSATGRPEREYRSAQREGTPTSAKGRPEREHRSAQREGTPTSATGRPEREGTPMTHLNIETNIAAPDDFYESLISLHRGLSDEQSALVNAKLILLLAN